MAAQKFDSGFGGGGFGTAPVMRSSGATTAGEAADAGGGAISAFGAIEEGQATANTLGFSADVATQNANEATQAGQFNVLEQQIMAHRAIGSMNASFGASGVSNMGSSAQAEIAGSVSQSELDRLNLIHQADISATNYQNQATADKNAAENAITGSYYNALGSLIKAGASAAAAGA